MSKHAAKRRRLVKMSYVTQLFRSGVIVIGPDRKRLLIASLMAFVVGIFETLQLYLIASIAVAVTSGKKSVQGHLGSLSWHFTITGTVEFAGVLLIALFAISVPLSLLLASLSSRAIIRMRERVLHSYLASTPLYRASYREGYLQQLIGQYCQQSEIAVRQLATFCVTLCTLSVVLAGAVLTNPVTAGGVFVGLAITSAAAAPLARRAQKNALATTTVSRDISGQASEMARLSEEIAAYDVGDRVAMDISVRIRQAAESLRRLRFDGRIAPSLHMYGTLAVVLGLIGILSVESPGRLAGLAPLVLLLVRALMYVRQLLTSTQGASEVAPYIESIDAEVKALDTNRSSRNGAPFTRFGGLELDRVGFEYRPGHPVLQEVSLQVRPGEIVGMIGPSGNGKTSLAGVILRLLPPTTGSISTGGVPLGEISPSAWSAISAFVPQDTKLIFGSAADNIRFYRDGYDLKDVEEAARSAHVHDEIAALPEGYDTIIGPGARNLSGGQRQRLAIARALLSKPQLLVLDEPTSALDHRSELLISQTLEELKGSVTILLIAHRPVTLEVCDRVFRVSRGIVTEIPVAERTP